MKILLAMLATLVAPVLLALVLRAAGREASLEAAGIAGIVLLFLFAASGHFIATAAMVQMLPAVVPQRALIVLLTGVLEIALALGMAWPATRRAAGIGAIAALVAFFPANVYAALARVPVAGHDWGPLYLLVRTPLQGMLIVWAWWFTVRMPPALEAASTGVRRAL